MTDKFPRITVDTGFMSGLATIRDTKIAVYEIATRLTNGETTQSVLAAYPALEEEDLIQTLAYSTSNYYRMIDGWRFQGESSLITIKGYLQFARLQELNALSTDSIVGQIERASDLASKFSRQMTWWNRVIFNGVYPSEYNSLEAVINELRSHELLSEDQVEIRLPSWEAKILWHPHTETALQEINRWSEDSLKAVISLEIDITSQTVKFISKHEVAAKYTNDLDTYTPELFSIASPVSVAAYIIYLMGGELKTTITTGLITFSFDLRLL